MFIKTFPKQVNRNDVSFFNGGVRLSAEFINRENLQDYKSAWLYVDKEEKRLGISFHKEIVPQSLPLTSSSSATIGKTVWCSYLKEFDFIKWVMEDPDIKNRRFTIDVSRKVSNHVTQDGVVLKYTIDLSGYQGIPF